MASFVPCYRKKRWQLEKHEFELRKLLQKRASDGKIFHAVETVRAAQLRVLRSRISQLLPCEKSASAIAELERQVQYWLNIPHEAILASYQKA